jgi:hypothetical protein
MDPATIALLASTGGSLVQGLGSFLGSNSQADAAKAANAAYQQQVQPGVNFTNGVYNTAQGNLNPYIQAGATELPQYQNSVNNYTQAANPTVSNTFNESNWQDPGYAFRVDQANQAIEGSTASKGMTLGSGALKSLQTRGQDMASQEYQNAYDRYNTDANRQFNQNQQIYTNNMGYQNQNIANQGNLVNAGYTASNALNGVGENTATQLNGLYTGLGNMAAGSQSIQGQAQNNMWNNAGNFLGGKNGLFQNLGAYFGGSSPGSAGGATGSGGLA